MPQQKTQFGGASEFPATQTRIGVGVIVVGANREVLLEKRSDCGLWGLLGGRVEPGESIHQTARREVKEESGLDIDILTLVGMYSGPIGRLVTYPGELHAVHLIDVILSAKVTGGTLACSPESEELRFFSTRAFPAEIVPPAVAPLRDFCLGRTGIID